MKNFMNNEELIVKTAIRTLEIEAEAIIALQSTLNQQFVDLVKSIFQSKGRLVITGLGKSAIVGQKIVATLNSTGTPALFMHAVDAIHGDLGMITTHDWVLCISKSGETPEIKVLIPLVKHLGNPLVAMVSNTDSYLAKQAAYILHTPILQEADPNNLAPTASTTAQMAMGDALATSLLALRGFSAEDFARFHPGGSLGKQLYLRVKDIYPLHEKPSVKVADSISQVIVEITTKRLGATAVTDENGTVLGIITDGDLRRMIEKYSDFQHLKAIDIMSNSPKTIDPEAMAVSALHTMQQYSITQLLVASCGRYLGMVHLHDLIKEGIV